MNSDVLKEKNRVRSTEYWRLAAGALPQGNPVSVFYDVFQNLKDDTGRLPRDRFHPMEHTRLLPWVQMYLETEPLQFKCILMGTGVRDIIGRDVTGLHLTESVPGLFQENRVREFVECHETGNPVLSESLLPFEDKEHVLVLRGAFPGMKDGRRLIYLPLAMHATRIS